MSDVGRPTVFTDEVIQKLEQAFQNGFSIVKACELSGIGHSAYYNQLERDQGFVDKMKRAQDYALEIARQNVVKAIVKEGDVRTSRWYLERKAKDEFATRQENVIETTEADRSAIREWANNLREQLPPAEQDTPGNE